MVRTSKEEALRYHREGRPGKIEIRITKPCINQQDLSLAYSPGVAEPVRAIQEEEERVFEYTAKGNLVAVISNGTAVLGLGNVGPLASKPVMEGKGVLFKRFADVDVFDLELDAPDPKDFVQIVKGLAPTFGGINLEDIKAPECFTIEQELIESLDIPVFHDDQHGTAIIAGAALLNALKVSGKRLQDVRVVVNGAGAAAIACSKFLISLGVEQAQLVMVDSQGVIFQGRSTGMNPYKMEFAAKTEARTLDDAIKGADVFLGLSVAGALKPHMLASMAKNPIVFALANPDPEIDYDEAKSLRPDALVATGRSDYPNQVNNVLGFPSIFRGALDVRARKISERMKVAAAQALAALAEEPVPEQVLCAYGVKELSFGYDYLIPKPVDPRVIHWVAPAVAVAAMEDGLARRPVNIDDYKHLLDQRFPQD
jgi:malate dehydrogenase (oxaloacetate-decarboxylating)(NADP+)